MNWLAIAPWLLSLVFLIGGGGAFGWEYATVKERNVTIANMEADKAKDIAAAEKAVRESNAKDAATSAVIVDKLHTEKREIEEKLNAASIALAQVPPPVTPPGCPDPMSRADVAAFERGLPSDVP